MKNAGKTVLKASTHVFTVSGVIVAASPVIRGVTAATKGDFTGAKNDLLYDTIQSSGGVGTSVDAQTAIKAAVVNVAIPLAVGIGLVWGGGQLRKRIGN